MTADRADTIRGLRQLASFLERHPNVPLPTGLDRIDYCILDDDDTAGRAEVERVAELLEVGTRTERNGMETSRHFGGGVTYRAFYIYRQRMAQHRADITYAGCVTP